MLFGYFYLLLYIIGEEIKTIKNFWIFNTKRTNNPKKESFIEKFIRICTKLFITIKQAFINIFAILRNNVVLFGVAAVEASQTPNNDNNNNTSLIYEESNDYSIPTNRSDNSEFSSGSSTETPSGSDTPTPTNNTIELPESSTSTETNTSLSTETESTDNLDTGTLDQAVNYRPELVTVQLEEWDPNTPIPPEPEGPAEDQGYMSPEEDPKPKGGDIEFLKREITTISEETEMELEEALKFPEEEEGKGKEKAMDSYESYEIDSNLRSFEETNQASGSGQSHASGSGSVNPNTSSSNEDTGPVNQAELDPNDDLDYMSGEEEDSSDTYASDVSNSSDYNGDISNFGSDSESEGEGEEEKIKKVEESTNNNPENSNTDTNLRRSDSSENLSPQNNISNTSINNDTNLSIKDNTITTSELSTPDILDYLAVVDFIPSSIQVIDLIVEGENLSIIIKVGMLLFSLKKVLIELFYQTMLNFSNLISIIIVTTKQIAIFPFFPLMIILISTMIIMTIFIFFNLIIGKKKENKL